MSDGIHNAADLFQKIGKNELKRKDLIKLAHQEASQESSEHLFRNLYSVFESIDKDKNGIFTKKEANVLFADGKSLEENFEDLKKARADNYNSRSPQEKLNIAVNDARQFLKDTDSKKIDPYNQPGFNGTHICPNIEKEADGAYYEDSDMIKISPSLVENFSRERLTGSILHEMVHASSKNYSSIQEETDAILLDENYLDLFGQGYASEKRENAEEIKEILRNHPSYAELPEYSTGHGIGSNFKSPLD